MEVVDDSDVDSISPIFVVLSVRDAADASICSCNLLAVIVGPFVSGHCNQLKLRVIVFEGCLPGNWPGIQSQYEMFLQRRNNFVLTAPTVNQHRLGLGPAIAANPSV